MTANSVEKLNNKENGLNFLRTYSWMKNNFSSALDAAFQEFWETGIDFNLVDISENGSYFFKGSEYFVTRIKLTDEHQFTVRIAKEAVQVLLDCSLGYNPDFEFEKITELEAKILTEFNNFIYEKFSKFLKTEEEVFEEEEPLKGDCYLTFFIRDLTEEPAKIIITIPEAFIKCEELPLSDNGYNIGDFPNARADVGIYVGSTTLTLNDIKNIEKEDIIVLDNSNINNMTLIYEDNKIGFTVSPDPSLIVSFDNDGSKNMSNENVGNIWDNIQVDISAEFDNVKISLGEIKQISEGLVIDIGSIYENKVFLKVENKVIADGELVIVNDRYGVKINQIFDETNNSSSNQESEIEQKNTDTYNETEQSNEEFQDEAISDETITEESNEENGENEEFDYKDFDVDDENI